MALSLWALPRGREGVCPLALGPQPPPPKLARNPMSPLPSPPVRNGGTLAKSFALGQGTPPGQSPPRSGIAELMQGGLWPGRRAFGPPSNLAKVPQHARERRDPEGRGDFGQVVCPWARHPTWPKSPLKKEKKEKKEKKRMQVRSAMDWLRRAKARRPEDMLLGRGQWEGPSNLPPGLP